LDDFINLPENSEIKSMIKEIKEQIIYINYSNFSYYDTMKKIMYLINDQSEKMNQFNKDNFSKDINHENRIKQITHDDKSSFSCEKEKLSLLEIPKSYEIIGNIAHLNLREKFLPYKYLIGRIILDKNPNLKTVITKTDKIDNIYRTYSMEILAGENNFLVVHREGNINFHFDIRNVYWCSRLQGERDRLLKIIKKGQILCDAFCGVGPLALRAAKQGVKVYSNDLNPDCYFYLKKNMQINKIESNMLYPFNMDARHFIRMCIKQGNEEDESENNSQLFIKKEKIDHIYMNLPKDALEFLDVFRGIFKDSEIYNANNLPIVHVYGFSNSIDPEVDLLNRISKALNIQKLQQKDFIEIHNIRDVSNKKHMFSISFRIPEEVAFE